MYNKVVKRLIDLVLSGLGIAVLSPVYLILAIAIKIDDPGPVFFRQKRVGLHKSHFMIMKFRTMKMETPRDVPTHLLQNPEQYITRMGKFLRKTSLDELPQLWNIFKGDMSIVGPRPALPREVELYNDLQKQRMYVTPGLTCYWQIQPRRNEISFDQWMEMDLQYILDRSFLVDWKIIFKTIGAVLHKEGE